MLDDRQREPVSQAGNGEPEGAPTVPAAPDSSLHALSSDSVVGVPSVA
jgi:hypothetical protein